MDTLIRIGWKGGKQPSQEIEEKVREEEKIEQDNEIIPEKRYTGQKKQQQTTINLTFARILTPGLPVKNTTVVRSTRNRKK